MPALAQLNAGEPDEIRPVETVQSQAPTRSGVTAAVDGICDALAAAAAENDLPVDFFTRLIWQESRFDPAAVSRAGAQGVAQFMPATASWRGLADPFDPIEAIAKSAKLLHDLRREFGNLGLAAGRLQCRARGGCATGSPVGAACRARRAPMCPS
jgi:hypothetical protein